MDLISMSTNRFLNRNLLDRYGLNHKPKAKILCVHGTSCSIDLFIDYTQRC